VPIETAFGDDVFERAFEKQVMAELAEYARGRSKEWTARPHHLIVASPPGKAGVNQYVVLVHRCNEQQPVVCSVTLSARKLRSHFGDDAIGLLGAEQYQVRFREFGLVDPGVRPDVERHCQPASNAGPVGGSLGRLAT